MMTLPYNKRVTFPNLSLFVAMDLSFLAAVYMKNRVHKGWSKATAESYQTNPILETDKMTFRPQLIQVLTVASPATRVQFTSMLSKIIRSDYPNDWPEFTDLTLNLLHSNQISEVYSGLTMLNELTKLYRWKSGDNRIGLDAVIINVFPVALQIAGKLLAESTVVAGAMLVHILKSYKAAIAVPTEPLWSDCSWNCRSSFSKIRF
jgi:importin-7